MPVIKPLRQAAAPVRVGVLTDKAIVVDEDGRRLHPRSFHERQPNLLVYASVETAEALHRQGIGETLVWDSVPKRWRFECHPEQEQWWPRRSDVAVLAHPLFPPTTRLALAALRLWRDWLESYGAHPTLSLSGTAMSLLRATLRAPLRTMAGETPPFYWTMGPRVYLPLYVDPYTSFRPAHHLDLGAAYPRAMASLPFGEAIWRRLDGRQLARMGADEREAQTPLVVRARIRLPEGLVHGPLPRRRLRLPDLPYNNVERCEILGGALVARYPTEGEWTGVWAWRELAVAAGLGAEIEPLDGWMLQHDGSLPFWPWWEAVLAGRELPRFAGLLAKGTANALWGAFVPTQGQRRLVGPGYNRRLPIPALRPPSHDLAELLTASVRAQGARMMQELGERLLSFHTDGGWVAGKPGTLPEGWTVKMEARQLDLVDPQRWRYWPKGRKDALYVVAGRPRGEAEQAFLSDWGEVLERRAVDELIRERRRRRRGLPA